MRTVRNNLRSSLLEQDKEEITEYWLKHINCAKSERVYYNKCIRQSKEEPDSMNYVTLDFSENFVLPYRSHQPGPVYFKVLFRVNNFGIINKAILEQVNHLSTKAKRSGSTTVQVMVRTASSPCWTTTCPPMITPASCMPTATIAVGKIRTSQ